MIGVANVLSASALWTGPGRRGQTAERTDGPNQGRSHRGRVNCGQVNRGRWVTGWLVVHSLLAVASARADALPDQQIKFFESKVRPILVEHCYQCHSTHADDIEAGLVLDSRQGWDQGGDSGPAIVPGSLEESLLIQAIRYEEDVVSGMPPRSKLPDESIAILEQWVAMGAPDPRDPVSADAPRETFDLKQRFEDHWSWRPIASPEPPATDDRQWARNGVDPFVLAKLEHAELRPAEEADKRIWLRRVYLDLIGLPPSVEQVQNFLADDSDEAANRVVDQLLDSAHFGEKWARHWMDLVRYSETYGHEFDYPIRSAHEYRDYLIRAFNQDLPYDEFVKEQIAGDLIDPPRRHPDLGFNESVIGTGFWYFHDATHAPTDALGNEADIINNQIDVFGTSFLGLTVACARCHDHKFDAISTADYYALSAFIQSSCRQYAPLDVENKIESLSSQIEGLRQRADQRLRNADGLKINQDRLADLANQARDQNVIVESSWEDAGSTRFEDFQAGDLPSGWSTSGTAFQVTDDSMLSANGEVLSPGTIGSRKLGRKQQGILRSPTFTLTNTQIHLRVKSTANMRINLIIDNYHMAPFNALLFRGTFIGGKESDTHGKWQWKSLAGDLQKYVGHNAYLEFIDENDGFIEIDEIRFSDGGAPKSSEVSLDPERISERWTEEVDDLHQGQVGPLIAWLIQAGTVPLSELSADANELIQQANQLADQLPAPRYVLAMSEGTRENAKVYVRGSHRTLGEEVPARFLEALGGKEVNRLDLANEVASEANPLTARVIVNRLWHHMFGRGLVASVDDFGPQGKPPSHPELLDWLATDLIEHQWSLKHTLRTIALSQTYRQASVSHPQNSSERLATVDPTNVWLHKMPVRRLSSETIRDSILAISGRLDTSQFGPSVPTHLTPFMTGRGRPEKSGPLDGNGRRSIYLKIARNFMNPFMLTFDMPSPFGPQGQRSRSNVPAQALTLLNDPLVRDAAKRWADNLLAMPDLDDRQRAALMIEQAHGTLVTPSQAQAIEEFLVNQSELYGATDARAWADLAHSILNMKAFYYVR